jgi:hypothetical protein
MASSNYTPSTEIYHNPYQLQENRTTMVQLFLRLFALDTQPNLAYTRDTKKPVLTSFFVGCPDVLS